MEYLDFELEIDSGSEGGYFVKVIHSPAGETPQKIRVPSAKLDYDTPSQIFGEQLFNILFPGEVRTLYYISENRAITEGKGLRLKLHIRTAELISKPWELLYDPRRKDFLGLSSRTPIIRYLELPQPITPLTINPPLRILGMIANPSNLEPLDVSQEKQHIEDALKDLQSLGLVDLTWLEGQTWNELQRELWKGDWHIFHFIGHGGFDENINMGYISLANENGSEFRLNAMELGRLLSSQPSLRLVLLNSCEGAACGERDVFSSMAATLMRAGIPAILAMQCEISDQAAIEFTRNLYNALSDRLPVDAATVEGRKAIKEKDGFEWSIPVLYMRSPNGNLFDISQSIIQLPRAEKPSSPSEKTSLTSTSLVNSEAETTTSSQMNRFYHVDRFKSIRPGQIIKLNQYKDLRPEILQNHVDSMFPEGVSSWGEIYLLRSGTKIIGEKPYTFNGEDGKAGVAAAIELLFEYVRRSNYPYRPSRFGSFFSFESLDEALAFREKFLNSTGYIWEVECKNVFKADMNFLRLDNSLLVVSYNANRYWSGLPSGPSPSWEVLLTPPIQVLRAIE